MLVLLFFKVMHVTPTSVITCRVILLTLSCREKSRGLLKILYARSLRGVAMAPIPEDSRFLHYCIIFLMRHWLLVGISWYCLGRGRLLDYCQ